MGFVVVEDLGVFIILRYFIISLFLIFVIVDWVFLLYFFDLVFCSLILGEMDVEEVFLFVILLMLDFLGFLLGSVFWFEWGFNIGKRNWSGF